VIEGLKLDVRADELVERLGERIAHHRERAAAYEAQLARLGEVVPEVGEDDPVLDGFRAPERPQVSLERKRGEHAGRAEVLAFIRDHIVRGEVYRLDEEDLRGAEILPRRLLW